MIDTGQALSAQDRRDMARGGEWPKRAIAILIDPKGEEWFDAYGPMTKDRLKATSFVSAKVAGRAAMRRFGRTGEAFWNSERESERRAEREHRGWTYRVEEID